MKSYLRKQNSKEWTKKWIQIILMFCELFSGQNTSVLFSDNVKMEISRCHIIE